MVYNYKLGSDIFNVAVWSNRAVTPEGKKEVHCLKRLLFMLLALIVISAQIQICFMIINGFDKSMIKTGDLQKAIKWELDIYFAAVLCFILTAYQVFDDCKQRIIVMANERNWIKWILAYISYVGNVFVATAVFFTILQQTDVNDLLCNFAGLLVIIQIDDFIGAWAVEYMIEDQDEATFLTIQVTDMEHRCADIWTCLLMITFSVWTSLYYKLLASYTHDSDSKYFLYTTYSGGFFFVWPIFQLIFKCCFMCCCGCCNRDDPEKQDHYEAMEEMMEHHHCHDHDTEFKDTELIVSQNTEKLGSMEEQLKQIDEMMEKLSE